MTFHDSAAHPRHLEIVQGTMRCGQLFVPNLQSAGLANPAQRALDHLSNATQPAVMRHARRSQVVSDAPSSQPPTIDRSAVGPVAIDIAWFASGPTTSFAP